ncbi:methionyl-tRNA formyltransferase [Roseixanthobacter glucoisosaccharinicivorans]|uniref:methionyl-tRNA formyltransferase n=1 Tax=Roseixanthobacter glucoisosaccharinicivorans TaxID=3119923 RepID=UPI0037286524
MALITAFNRQQRDRYTTHKPIEANYFVLGDGEARLIQIDTLGTSDREFPGKLSQTIQLNRDAAEALYSILAREFGFK